MLALLVEIWYESSTAVSESQWILVYSDFVLIRALFGLVHWENVSVSPGTKTGI
jgi:hypothetical protein